MRRKQGVAAMVRTFPQILGLSPKDNMDPKIAWLKDALDVDDERVLVLVKVKQTMIDRRMILRSSCILFTRKMLKRTWQRASAIYM